MSAERKLILALALFLFWACGEIAADVLYPADTISLPVRY